MSDFENFKLSKEKRLRKTKKDKFVADNRRSVFKIEEEKMKRADELKKKQDEKRKKGKR